jgi:hypothetical protein
VPQYSSWATGNGELTPDGWVRQKSLSLGVRKEGERYRLVVLDAGL